MNRDSHLLAEAYKIVREQGSSNRLEIPGILEPNNPLAKPMMAMAKGAYKGYEPYGAGAVAGVKQLGQNVARAVTGSQQAPQSPMAAAKQAFTQQQVNDALDSVMQAYNLPDIVRQQVDSMLRNLSQQRSNLNQHVNQYNTGEALRSTGQSITPSRITPPRINPAGGTDADGFSVPMVKPGYAIGGQVPASQALQNMQRAAGYVRKY